MRINFRTAAFAAAAASFCAAAFHAVPSLAFEAEAIPAIHYGEHAVASAAPADLAVNQPVESAGLAHDVHFSTQIANHAVAEAAPEAPRPADPAPASAGRSLAQLVRDFSGSETSDEEMECLARAVYYESKGEPLAGQLTVAEVILNRADSGRFPSTICGVVRQPSQFSFVRRGHIPRPPADSNWRTAVAIAHIAMEDLAEGSAPRALFFHARRVSPGWRGLTRVATIGNHVFYR